MRAVLAAAAMAATIGGGLSMVRVGAESEMSTPAPRYPAALEAALAHVAEEAHPVGDGALAIGNAAYRARFSADGGVVYTPRIDGREEGRLRWQYRLRAIEAGRLRTTLAPVAPRVSAIGAHVVDFERPGLIERYQGERTGVEQIFVLTERPTPAGDVRIRGDVTFAGTARVTAGGAITFTAAGAPPFTYAAPIAFDATGAALPVRAELEGTELHLVLDGAALSRARLPVTIDPLFGVTTLEEAATFWGIDLAYCADRDEFLAVFPGGDGSVAAIRARRFRATGDPIGPSFTVAPAAADSSVIRPSVGYDPYTKRYLVAWIGTDPMQPDPVALYGVTLDPIGQPLGPPLSLAPGDTLDFMIRPTVAARQHRHHGPGDVGFAVSYRTLSPSAGNLVKVARVRGDGSPAGTAIMAAGTAPGIGYDPLYDRFLVAYTTGKGGTVFAKTLTAGGAVAGAATSVAAGACSQENVAVTFDAASRRYLAAYQLQGAAGGCDLRASLLGPTATPAVIGAATLETGSATVTHEMPGAAAEAGTFLVGYVTLVRENGVTTATARTRRLRADGLLLGSADWGPAETGVATHVPVAAGVHGSTPLLFQAPFGGGGWPLRMAMGERWISRSIHAHGDADGDGRSDLVVYQPFTDLLITRTQSTTTSMVFAVPGGFPALLDWDGDGRTDRCVWEPGTGTWWLFESSTSTGYTMTLGRTGDMPVPADYLGLGRDQLAVFRPSTGIWYIKSTRVGSHPASLVFGQVGDMPVPADWDGDGDIEPGLWRPSTGLWSAVQPDGTPVAIPATAWGGPGDVPLSGNFVGDATADQVVYRRQLGVAYVRDGATGATSTVQIGDGLPMPIDWDGDGHLNLALFDQESGVWRIRVGSQTQTVTFAAVGDIPAGR